MGSTGSIVVRLPRLPARTAPQPVGRQSSPASSPAFVELQRRLGNRAVGVLLRDAGRPLPDDVRGRMEAALGSDLAGVRVHDDAPAARAAALLRARAFTAGDHVFFGGARYAPRTTAG